MGGGSSWVGGVQTAKKQGNHDFPRPSNSAVLMSDHLEHTGNESAEWKKAVHRRRKIDSLVGLRCEYVKWET